jgi:hypothetical protein
MGLRRSCITCGRVIEHGSYCPGHEPERLRGRKWMRKRAVVFRRANWTCENCGDRIAEEVHHLNGPRDNSWDALLAVCRKCHRELEAEKRR